MRPSFESTAEEITRLRGCLSDLRRITDLSTLRMDGELSHNATRLLDALVGQLHFSFAFVRLNWPTDAERIEATRVAEPWTDFAHAIRETVDIALRQDPPIRMRSTRAVIGDVEFSITSAA